jgi:hypothetical protein
MARRSAAAQALEVFPMVQSQLFDVLVGVFVGV